MSACMFCWSTFASILVLRFQMHIKTMTFIYQFLIDWCSKVLAVALLKFLICHKLQRSMWNTNKSRCIPLQIKQNLREEAWRFSKKKLTGLFCMYMLWFNSQLIEGNGYKARQTSKEQTKMPRFTLEGRRPRAHNLLFCAYTLCMNYAAKSFLLASSSVSSKQLLCFVHGQGQKS